MMERLAMDVIGLARQPGAYAGTSMNTPVELIARARHGDEEAFRLIFERYTRPVVSFISHMVGRRETAEELAQETFLRAYRSLGALRDETKLSTWLFGIARNVVRESLRERARAAVTGADFDGTDALRRACDDGDTPAGRLLDKELGGLVRDSLRALDEDKRLVFTLKVYQQLSYEEISEATGFSVPKVRNDLHRARAEMRRRLGPYMGVKDEV